MATTFSVLVGIALVGVVLILTMGILTFVRGGEFNRRWGGRLMNFRVAAQGLVLLLLVFLFLLRKL
jgi:hypothetical protein